MLRRDFIALLGGATVGLPLPARAQQPERMRRVGVLLSFAADDPESPARRAAFVQQLQQLGWTDGRNVQIDIRWGASNAEASRKYAAELVALAPDVIAGRRQSDGGGAATGNPHRADRVRQCHRSRSAPASSQAWRGRAVTPPGFTVHRIRHEREMVGTA